MYLQDIVWALLMWRGSSNLLDKWSKHFTRLQNIYLQHKEKVSLNLGRNSNLRCKLNTMMNLMMRKNLQGKV
jgi:hypothetical protein